MSILELYEANSKKYIHRFLPSHRVDVDTGQEPLEEGTTYCQLYLVEMGLAKGVEKFKEKYPVAHTAVSFDYNGETKTIPTLVGPSFFKQVTDRNLDRVIQCNFPLTGRFPFNRGEVRLDAGLFSLTTGDPLGDLTKSIGRFSDMLKIPEFSTVVNVAGHVFTFVDELIGSKNNQLELGYQQTFRATPGDSQLREGYFFAILAEESQIKSAELCVVNDSLCLGRAGTAKEFMYSDQHVPFKGYSYMLFRIEKHRTQDWEALKGIESQVRKAQNALRDAIQQGSEKGIAAVKKQLLPGIMFAIYQSPDVAKSDRKPMYLKIEAELKELGLEGPSGEIQLRTLNAIMSRTLPESDPSTAAELDLMERLYTPEN